ncbi:MAG TPA: chemotaxis protein CheC [Gaiellaceae bacterium]|nr:chemotaxis protein CheC [Gaiellaceae bacterium]
MKIYSELELDALRELANIGSGTAATALSQMLARTIDVSVPTALALPLNEAVETVGDAELVVTGVVLPVFGDLDGLTVLLFEEHDANRVCELLGVEPESEFAVSALAEIGNILCSSYLGAIVSMTGLRIEPGPPQTACDMLGAIVESVLAIGAQSNDVALLLDSDIRIEGEESSFTFMLVPSTAGVAELLARLGLGA